MKYNFKNVCNGTRINLKTMEFLSVFLIFGFSSIFPEIKIQSTALLKRPQESGDDVISVRKMYDSVTKRYWMESDDGSINSRSDLENISRKKNELFREKHGAITRELVKLLEKKNKNDSVKVCISLVPPQVECLDKTKYSEEVLRENSIKAAAIELEHLEKNKNLIKIKHESTLKS